MTGKIDKESRVVILFFEKNFLIKKTFLARKKQEFEALREEINSLEKTVGNILNSEDEDV